MPGLSIWELGGKNNMHLVEALKKLLECELKPVANPTSVASCPREIDATTQIPINRSHNISLLSRTTTSRALVTTMTDIFTHTHIYF
jgi:hypothetical protein